MSKAIEPREMMEIEVFTDDPQNRFYSNPLAPKTILRVEGRTIITSSKRLLSSGEHTPSFRYTFVDGKWRESFSDGLIHMFSTRVIKHYGTGTPIQPKEQSNDE
jgi:hypothetical protein